MDISVLCFGFGFLNETDEHLYERCGSNVEERTGTGNFYVDAEGDHISGDSAIALGLCRTFRELGHDARATHYENVEATSSDADLVVSLGPGAVEESYQEFGGTDAVYWWWHCGGFGESPDANEYVRENLAGSAFDGVLTNGRATLTALKGVRPHRHLHIGYDNERIQRTEPHDEYDCDVVYVGSGDINPGSEQEIVLGPATEYDLQVYGTGWEDTRFEQYHRGILPRGELGAVYSSASVVLGLQGDYVELGMVNDRVFQALACDAVFVDRYHELYAAEPVSEYVTLTESPSETAEALDAVLSNPDEYRRRARRGGEFVRENHTFVHKAEAILDFYAEEL
jgi:spore maturation protein CgeB